MTAHVVDLQTQIELGPDGEASGRWRYRWRCSCGDAGKRWFLAILESGSSAKAARSARNGGARHVAAQERGR